MDDIRKELIAYAATQILKEHGIPVTRTVNLGHETKVITAKGTITVNMVDDEVTVDAELPYEVFHAVNSFATKFGVNTYHGL